jgi:dihydroorotate dehydrogenase (NAD+) catalytic subunit
MNRLQRNVLGLTFNNPILPASGTFAYGEEIHQYFYNIGDLGGLITKGISSTPWEGNPTPRCAETPGGMLNAVGLQNPGVEAFIKAHLPFMRSHGIPVIAQAIGKSASEYLDVVKKLCVPGINAIELNVSCPNIATGCSFGQDPTALETLVRDVKKICKLPLIVKLTPNITNITTTALAAERGGADAISLINTVAGMAVDIETRKPILGNRVGGLSGPCIKPIALKMVHDVYKAVKIPIIGCGGISNYVDVLEFMLCGATLVQVGTLNMTNPMETRKIIDDLNDWCVANNIKSLDEILGTLRA